MRLARGQFFGQREVACRTSSLDLVLTSYARGQSLPPHEHERAYLVVVLAGSFREEIGRSEHRLRQGALLLNTCGARHHDTFEAERTEVLNVELGPRWLEALGLERPTDPRVTDGRRFLGRMRTLRRHLLHPEPLSAFVVEGLCAELIAHGTAQPGPERRASERPALAVVERVLAERLREPPSLLELATLAGLAPTRLTRAWRARHGCSIGERLRELRVAHARAAVLRAQASLSAIALESGYADQSHMTREFRRRFGCTPGELRALRRKP